MQAEQERISASLKEKEQEITEQLSKERRDRERKRFRYTSRHSFLVLHDCCWLVRDDDSVRSVIYHLLVGWWCFKNSEYSLI